MIPFTRFTPIVSPASPLFLVRGLSCIRDERWSLRCQRTGSVEGLVTTVLVLPTPSSSFTPGCLGATGEC